MPATRAEASQRVRESIVEATVRIVAREGVAAVTHRRVAAEAEVSLSSTTWHYATKADILEAALHWSADHEVARIGAIAERLDAFDVGAWADELADWLLEQLGPEREATVALYRLQAELLGSPGALAVHRQWGRGLRALGDQVLGEASELDVRLVIAALDGLRMTALASGELDEPRVRAAVRRQLEALLG
ncbi:TetR family transcriptional regulator [Solirubrobacter phytolaccae]|uniref:TetR family transcriptional regulator n=1 Tax=Solirubrobacter phytolaccae TaxID=1404360 RepID=A0A9X3NAN9_9ACTN|nr:TetR family transcriptional regulator [Solirubrobacter phytolaccae]MDA0183130.1 TetR family transcriptional regulator [Solirubrobacter phytolaccae]